MTEIESTESPSGETSAPPEPPPEPWTPARVTEWNAYYDLYVALGVLLLVFVVSANKMTHSSIWSWLQAGRTMAHRGTPLAIDPFSYTESGHRWVNIPWLFEWSHALIYDGVFEAAPSDPTDPIVSTAAREQLAAGALVALTALARLATALLLLRIRRPGPGLWWSAITAAVALGALVGPGGLGLGGIAGAASVAPSTWGTLLLTIELYLWHRAVDLGRRNAIFGMIPLFLVWANVDESFPVGLLVLLAGVIGRGIGLVRGRSRQPGEADPLPLGRGMAIVGTCVAICLVNPSFYRVFPAALASLWPTLRLSPFAVGRGAGPEGQIAYAWVITLLYLVLVGLGFASFVLNRRRFSPSRFLMFAVVAFLWGTNLLYRAEFAPVFAVTLALNGQEWYHDRFGTLGRLGRGWSVWSVGGRAVTIVLVFACVAIALTGWTKSPGDPIFGFGLNPDAYAFEVAEFLKTAKIDGRVLNTTPEQGDALLWRAYPIRQTFIDSRKHLFPATLTDRLQQTRVALSKDDVAGWKPLLDEYKISVVMIDEPSSPRTYQQLLHSPNWSAFYDDGSVVLFGRVDAGAPATDVAYFKSHRLSAEALAYRGSRLIPSFDRPPSPVTWIDRIFRNRSLLGPQPHTAASFHWLNGQGANDPSETGPLPDPAHCFLAIQEARIALARRPDDPLPYRLLSETYRVLMTEESALLGGIKLTPENAATISKVEPRINVLMSRFRQRVTALNDAIRTTPYTSSNSERQALFSLNYQLFQLYMSVNFLDLARERLQAMLEQAPEMPDPDAMASLNRQSIELNGQIKQIQDQINDQTIERQLGPLERAGVARGAGAPGIALAELEEAERTGVSPAIVRPQLVDLYCDTGQPEKALELLNTGNVEDPSLGSEPGAAAYRQAKVNFLLGNYEYAAQLWESRAIMQLRYERSGRALTAALALVRGQANTAISMFLDMPGKIGLQATWEYDLALCRLESGRPALAAEPLAEALILAPDMALRPVAAYYLEKLGKPVPPASPAKPSLTSKDETTKNEEAKDDKPKDGAAKDEKPEDGKPAGEDKAATP